MQTPRPAWSLWHTFLTVMERGSLLGAARALGCHQPTVSRQIAALEETLGQPLFERGGRGLTPTALAHTLLEPARRMADGAQALNALVQGGKSTPAGTVRIAASQVVAAFLLPALLPPLRMAEPAIGLELVTSNAVSNLLRREADIAIRLARPQQGGLIARKLGELWIGAYAHEAYLARHPLPRSPHELLQHTLIGLDTDPTLDRALAGAGLAVERKTFWLRTDDQVAYTRTVMTGGGIGWIPRWLAEEHGQLVPVLPQQLSRSLPVWLVVHREIRGSLPVRRVFDYLAHALIERLAPRASPPPRRALKAGGSTAAR